MSYKLIIGWLYPELMSTYGDRGNIMTLQKRCEWRDIQAEVKHLDVGFSTQNLRMCDLLFMGGAEDKQQKIVSNDLSKDKIKALSEMVNKEIPGLYICGAYQLLGKYYKEADGTIIDGLDIFDLHTIHPGIKNTRLTGNIAFQSQIENLKSQKVIGFENHGGRTYLGQDIQPLGAVLAGSGNNGEDRTEGAIFKNSLGTYCHGPMLPKNPIIADFLIEKALEIKYRKKIALEPLDDTLSRLAHDQIAKRLQLGV